MSGSIYGNLFTISTWGESHGKGIGVVVDGCPAGLPLSEEDIQPYLDRRKPGQTAYATPRKEDDEVEILSGVFEGKTTGAPISMIVHNKRQRSGDYKEIENYYRPGHADYAFDLKYGFRDYRGGGRSSGRETTARVAAGAIASKILKELGIDIFAYTKSIGPVVINEDNFSRDSILKNPICMPDLKASKLAEEYLSSCMDGKDSSGGMIECLVNHVPAGLGEPVFEKLDANLAKAIMSIGAVKGVEIGDGMAVAGVRGSQNNDSYQYDKNGKIIKASNHSGGITGGISDGSQIIIRAAIKPTSSISATQNTINKDGENIQVSIGGRHDPVIVPRAVVVVESMVAITLVDMLFISMTSKMDNLTKFFKS